MKTSVLVAVLVGFAIAGPTAAQVAGSTTAGLAAEDVQTLYTGWSVKKQILDEPVYNDAGDQIGTIQDLIIAPTAQASYAIIGVGGFLGLGQHDVAIPVGQLNRAANGKLVLSGVTKEALKGMPEFEWAKKK